MPVGSSIRVDSSTHGAWTFERTEQGWSRSGGVVDEQFFTGYIAAGVVTDAAKQAPRMGDWYRGRRYLLWVRKAENADGYVECLRWNHTRLNSPPEIRMELPDTLTNSATIRRVTEPPPEALTHATMQFLVEQWEAAMVEVARLRELETSIRTERDTLKNRPAPDQLRQAIAPIEQSLAALRTLIGGDLDEF